MSDDSFTNTDANAHTGVGSPPTTGPASNTFGGSPAATPPFLTAPTLDAATSWENMQRVRALGIKPFGDNPPPTVLPPNMLALTPQLADKYPNIYNPTLFAKSMDTYGPRWGMDRATVLKTSSSPAGGENQDNTTAAPPIGQEHAKRPDENFTHNGIGYYRRNGQLYSAGSDDPNLELKVTPEIEAKIMKERAEQQPLEEQRQKSSEALKQRLEVYAPQWEENAMPGSDNHDFLDGVFAMPDGDNPYEGKNLMQQAGRLIGSQIPAWDEGRKTAQIGYGMWEKHNRGEEITSSDVANLTDHALEAGADLGAYTGTGLLLWAGRRRALSEIKRGYNYMKNMFFK